MRWLLILLTVIFSFNSVAGQNRKKVAVVLGGGGAKGVAHIGVLKVLEEAGVPIDMVSGTSMGAIVGGLYAIGYSPEAIQQMVRAQNWKLLLSDKVKRDRLYFPEKENSERYIVSFPFGRAKKDRIIDGVIKGQNLKNLFSDLTIGYHDAVDFNNLLIPYSCVSVDLVSGRDYVYRKGSLPQAMRASMAIPGVITPVRLDSMVLIDGGLNNNYPANVACDMGADIIIGVDLSTSDLKNYDNINSPSDILGQVVALHGFDRYQKNINMTDLLFRPNLEPYKSTSFTRQALDTLMARGEQEARSHLNEIMELKKCIGISVDTLVGITQKRKLKHPVLPSDRFSIRTITFKGADPRDEKWLLKISGLKPGTQISLYDLRKAMNILVGTNAYSYVNYELTGVNEDELQLTLQPKSVSSINVGVRFDTEEIAAVLVNATYDYRKRNLSKLSFTGRAGATTASARFDYSIERSPLRNFNLSYQFRYQDLDFYHKGKKELNTSYSHHLAELAYSDMNWMNFKLKCGLRYEYFNYKSFLYKAESEQYNVKPEDFISYFITAHLETYDRRYYPSKGVSLRAGYSLYTDNFVNYRNSSPFSVFHLDFSAVWSVSSHFSIVPSVAGRVLAGNLLAFPFLNEIGGESAGHYTPQQLPFAGINRIEIVDNAVAVVGVQLRERILGQHYVTLTGNLAVHDDDFFDLLHGKYIWGARLGYAYNSIFGPLSTGIGISNRNHHPQFYMNLGYYF